jgi:Tfp pilus assembly protein PilF
LCVSGAAAFLIQAAHTRAPGQVITGSVGQSGSASSQQSRADLQAAEQAVYRHPRSYDALLRLGTAYLQNGRITEADLSYRAAMQVDPARADAPTFHAMLLGAIKRYGDALHLLTKVERDHRAYARAWLIDGILSSHVKNGRERAVAAWLRFLLLEPQSDLAPKVRRWIIQVRGKKP